jgi:hypothetical protein
VNFVLSQISAPSMRSEGIVHVKSVSSSARILLSSEPMMLLASSLLLLVWLGSKVLQF